MVPTVIAARQAAAKPATRRARRLRRRRPPLPPRLRQPRSTAAGRESTTCRAAARSSSTSRRSRAGTGRRISWPSAPSRGGPRPATSRRSAPSSSRRTRRSRLTERLVSFQKMKIVEANFQTLSKEQIREITAEIDKAIPDDERVIALDRVLANVDKSQVDSEERRRHQGRSAAHLLQQDAGRHRQPRRRADLESDQGQRSEVRREHELGSVPARADQHLVSAQQRHVAEGGRREGPVGSGRDAARQLQEAAGGGKLEGCEGEPAGQSRSRRRLCRRSSSACSRPSSFC